MALESLTAENIDELIQGHRILAIYFWGDETPACEAYEPLLEAAAERFSEVCFVACKAQDETEVAEMFKIAALPTLVVFREHVLVFGQEGVLTGEQLDDLFSKVQALDMDEIRDRIARQEARLPVR